MLRLNKNNYLREKKITEEELENIHPDLNHNFPSTKINSGLMTAHHNDTEIFIDDLEDFFQYCS